MKKLLIIGVAPLLMFAAPAQARTPAECQFTLGIPGLSGPAGGGAYEKCLAAPENAAPVDPSSANHDALRAACQMGSQQACAALGQAPPWIPTAPPTP
jgi:hypothetical protein